MFDADRISKITNLITKTAGGGNPTPGLFVYDSADTRAAVGVAGYFNAYASKLETGCLIIAYCPDGVIHIKVTAVSDAGVVAFAVLGAGVSGAVAGLKIAAGQATTVTASDTVVTGLPGALVGVVATLNDAPALGCDRVTARIGTQIAAPAPGSFYLETWKPTAAGDATPIAATTFAKKVNWIAFSVA